MRVSGIAIAVLLASTAAMAGQSPPADCAAGLAKEPRTIYDASVAAVQPTTDLKGLLQEKTRGLVQAGTVERASARDSARAALKCLELVQKAE